LAWELTRDAIAAFETKVEQSRAFWSWRQATGWQEIRTRGVNHLRARLGPQQAAWPLTSAPFPEIIATRHQLGSQPLWVTATTGLAGQRMAGVEQYLDEPERYGRIELAIARPSADRDGAELLNTLASIPFGRCTWLGEGHTIGGSAGTYPAFGPDKAAVLLTATPPPASGYPAPDLAGLACRGEPVTYLWVMVIDTETFRMARGQDASTALAHLAERGASWIQ
jgi:hypothetical protein